VRLRTALSCLAFLIAPTLAHAGDVYKCVTAAGSVYQDSPCKNSKSVPMRTIVISPQSSSSSSSLATLTSQIQAASAAERQIQSDMDRDIALTKARLGSRVSDPSSNSEAIRIKNEWQPKMEAAQRNSASLLEEIRRRCPRGAALNGTTQTCNK
jgi:hypothetical protein